MERLHNPDNISNLSKAVSLMMELKCPDEEIKKYVRMLQLSCHGSPLDRFSMYYGSILSPSEILEAFFKVKNFNNFLRTDKYWSLRISNSLLKFHSLSSGCLNFLGELLPQLIFEGSVNDTEDLVATINNHKDFSRFPVSITEAVLQKETKHLELALLSMVEELIKNDPDGGNDLKYHSNEDVWKDIKYSHWVVWGSQSSVVFLNVTRILTQFLCMLKCKSIIFEILETYTKNISTLCTSQQKDLIDLYPLKLQSIIYLLQINYQELNPKEALLCQTLLCNKFSKLKDEPFITLSLLSQFPHWMPHVETTLKLTI